MKNKESGFTLIELIAVVAILGLIALIVYPAIGTVIKNSRESAYKDQVNVIITAAKTWSIDNASTLPDNGSVYRLDVDTLLGEGYITDEEIKDPRDSSKNLSGVVEIKYDKDIKQFTYNYIDNEDETDELLVNTSLADTIIENSKKKDILLANSGVYKGDNPDNYIKIDDKLWRIISNNEDGSVKVISDTNTAQIAWDVNGNVNFDLSTVKTYLNDTFFASLNSISNFKSSSFCTSYDGDKCLKQETLAAGLLTTEDYLNASNNLNCKTGTEAACKEGNYLSEFSESNGPEYTLNSVDDNISIINGGLLSTTSSKNVLNIRPVLTLDKNVKIIGGTGSKENPYQINTV